MTQTSAATPSSVSSSGGFKEPQLPVEVGLPAVALENENENENEPDQERELGEYTRLEGLLAARTRSHGSLQRELERRDRLFREALLRLSTSTSQEFSVLRAGYDAAVARAIEAEVARAELTFSLDETRAQLTAAQPSGGVGAQLRSPGVYGAAADLSVVASVASVASVNEREALAAQSADQRRRLDALRGELSGVRARARESEQALQAGQVQAHKLQQRLGTTQERLNELRSESAELTLLAQSRAARIAELSQTTAFDQQEVRTLRAQVAAATVAQVAQSDAREADRQLWAERIRQHEEREQAAWAAAAAAVARSESRLREFLGSLKAPLRELDASLDALNPAGGKPAETTQAGAVFDVSAEARAPEASPASAPAGRRIADELAQERDRRTKLVAAVRALQAATQSGEPTKPWIEELVELVSESRPSARRRS